MCTSPIYIKNPNKTPFTAESLRYIKDCISDYIPIPCGHCAQCISSTQHERIQRVICESLRSYVYMLTLTYNDDNLPHIKSPNGEDFFYPDYSDIQKTLKLIRKYNAFGIPFHYSFTSEYGSKRHRPHFHALLFFPKSNISDPFVFAKQHQFTFLNYWKRNIGTVRNPIYQPITTYHSKYKDGRFYRNYDFHFVSHSLRNGDISDVIYYVSKYTQKFDKWYSGKLKYYYATSPSIEDFNLFKKITQPKIRNSKHLGDHSDPIIYNYLTNCIHRSLENKLLTPTFFSPYTGEASPLISSYKSNLLTYDQSRQFYMHYCLQNDLPLDDSSLCSYYSKELNLEQIKLKESKSSHIRDFLYRKHTLSSE